MADQRKLPSGFRSEVTVTTHMGHQYNFKGNDFPTAGALASALEQMLADVRSYDSATPLAEVSCYEGTFSYTLRDGEIIGSE